MDVLDARLCLALHSLPKLGDRSLARLFQHYGAAADIWESDPGHWGSLGVSREAVSAARIILRRGIEVASSPIERQLDSLQRLDAAIISLPSPDYPVLLQTLYDPPPILYARGEVELLQQAQLGIVGSRRASPSGRRAALQLSAELVGAGLHVCSGLAVGIDQAAHQGALEAGGKTIAVMANGLDRVYPSRHRALARDLVQSGCLLSEFPPGAEPLPHRFPKRNRVISGLSLGVLVVEATLRSGSLITARTAMEQGREVFALPWSMFHAGGRGCLSLIRDGASLVRELGDILEELGPLYDCQRELALQPAAAEGGGSAPVGVEGEVLRLVGSEAISVDVIVEHSGLAVAAVLAALSALELERAIERSEGGYIRR